MKSLLSTIILLLLSWNAQAQLSLNPALFLGTSKLNSNHIPADSNLVFENKFSFSWGLGADLNYKINSHFSIQGGIYLEQIGHYWGEHAEVKKADAKFPYLASEPNPIRTYSNELWGYLYFASLPVSMQVHLNKFTLGAGLQYSQRLVYLGKYRAYTRLNAVEEIEWHASALSSYNLSYTLEAAYRIHPKWNLGLRFTQGLVDMQNGPWRAGESVRNTQIQLGLQYRIKLGQKE
ncbi:MAG: hypothetical protein EP332_13170 [Bacteroidetes bacterium]|nr:MAG: hypothetical protein EP332_13170 [Bacteroidota bacterium]